MDFLFSLNHVQTIVLKSWQEKEKINLPTTTTKKKQIEKS